MDCTHHGFHEIITEYDRISRVLRWVWTCESCGSHLNELDRLEYAPRFDRFVHEPQATPETAA
jgi:hypothetical protein